MNKKIFLIIIILILAVTGLVFFIKYRGSFGTSQPPSGPDQAPKPEPATVKINSVSAIGLVVSINANELVLRTGEGDIQLYLSSKPSVYMMEGQKRIDKKISDLKAGSQVKVHYLDNGTKKVPLVILVDKL